MNSNNDTLQQDIDNPFKLQSTSQQSDDDIPQWPIRGASKFSGEFGAGDARHQIGKSKEELEKYHGHKGTDVIGEKGAPVYPMISGVVSKVVNDTQTWHKDGDSGSAGNMIVVDHPKYGMKTKYLHLDSISVAPGQEVTKNTQIGTCGNSGSAKYTGPHVHFEVQMNSGESVNARPIIEGKKPLTPVTEKKAISRQERMSIFSSLVKQMTAVDRLWDDEDR